MDLPTNSSIVRSISNIDPVKSGVLLTFLDIPHLYKWTQDLMQLQRKHPHEELQWSLFISRSMGFRISAFNDANACIRNSIISGTTLNLPNEEVYHIILLIVLPKTEQEYIQDFQKLVHFRKLPKNQQECPPDPTRFTDWYEAILELIHEANSAVELLSAIPTQDFTPNMKTFNQKSGLAQLFYEKVPQKLGKNINDMIPYEAVKNCKSLWDYTRLFIIELNKINDCTENSKLNRSRLSTPFAAEKEPQRFNASKYTPNNNNFFNKHNNNNNSQIIPYKNPHEGRLNNMFHNDMCNDYYGQCDINDHNKYRENHYNDNNYNTDINTDNTDDNINDCDDYYDIDETFGNRSNSIEGSNPGNNLTKNLSYVDRDLETRPKQPCFEEIFGRCTLGSRDCKFSHDFKELQKEVLRRQAALATSKYLPKSSHTAFPNPRPPLAPTSIMKRDTTLRSMGVEEEFDCKVSNTNNNDTNNSIYNNNNRTESRDREDLSQGSLKI
jgi:hypothetical protein